MIGLYAGLRREEILALRWDCVFLDGATPYISVRRAWRSVNNRPVISTELKTPAAKGHSHSGQVGGMFERGKRKVKIGICDLGQEW